MFVNRVGDSHDFSVVTIQFSRGALKSCVNSKKKSGGP